MSETKQAVHSVGYSPIQAQQSDAAKAEALRLAARFGLLSAGLGATIGVARNLPSLLVRSRPKADPMEITTRDATIVPPTPEDEEEEKLKLRKRAVLQPKTDWADKIVANTVPTESGQPKPSIMSTKWLLGAGQTEPLSVPIALPMLAAATVGGGMGAHALTNWLTKRRIKADRDTDLDEAEQEYEEALKGLHKGASVDDCWEKLSSLQSVLGGTTGVALSTAATLALLSAYVAHAHTRKNDPAKAMAEVVDARTRLRAMSNPPPLRIGLANQTDDDDK